MTPFRYIVLLLLATVFVVLGVAQRASVVHLGYDAERLDAERALFAERNRQLQCEISTLSDPARIAEVAGRLDNSLLDPNALTRVSADEEPGRILLTRRRLRR